MIGGGDNHTGTQHWSPHRTQCKAWGMVCGSTYPHSCRNRKVWVTTFLWCPHDWRWAQVVRCLQKYKVPSVFFALSRVLAPGSRLSGLLRFRKSHSGIVFSPSNVGWLQRPALAKSFFCVCVEYLSAVHLHLNLKLSKSACHANSNSSPEFNSYGWEVFERAREHSI